MEARERGGGELLERDMKTATVLVRRQFLKMRHPLQRVSERGGVQTINWVIVAARQCDRARMRCDLSLPNVAEFNFDHIFISFYFSVHQRGASSVDAYLASASAARMKSSVHTSIFPSPFHSLSALTTSFIVGLSDGTPIIHL